MLFVIKLIWEHGAAIWSIFVFLLTFTILLNLRRWFRMYIMCTRLPGPDQHPIFGNAKEYMGKHRFLQHVMRWRESFPQFTKTFILFFPIIIIQSPELVQTFLARRKHTEKGALYHALRPLLGEGLITSKGEKWFTHRKLITPTFHFNVLESFVEVFVERTRDFMQNLKETDLSDFEISSLTQKLTLDLICETAMGTSIHAQNEQKKRLEIVSAMHKLEELATYRVINSWMLFDFLFQFSKRKKDQDKYTKILQTFTLKMIKERREALRQNQFEGDSDSATGKKRHIFMDLLIEMNDNGEKLTDTEIMDEVTTFMFAGQNTTQLAVNYGLYLLGHYPEVQQKAFEEQVKIFGDSDREPTMEDLRDMEYLNRCIKDTLRLFPSVPVIARKIEEDEKVGKYLLPAGADILVIPYVVHRNPEQFPNPETFDPDNFLPERVKSRHPYSYIPFSAGPRNCIGQKYAVLAQKIILSSILRKYRIVSLTRQKDLKVVPSTVLVPIPGLRLSFIPRNQMCDETLQ